MKDGHRLASDCGTYFELLIVESGKDPEAIKNNN